MLNVGIIGCAGHWGLALSSADRFNTCNIRAVASPRDGTDDAPLRHIALERSIPFYEDWKKMLDGGGLDLIVVDNRYDLHAKVGAECLRRGLHVYCEKPLATELKDLNMLESALSESGKALGGMFNLRYTPWFLAVQAALKSGEIGEIRLIHAQKSYKLGARPEFYKHREQFGGLIPWVAIHAIDWCLALGGKCQSVSALQSSAFNRGHGDLEMSAVLQLELEGSVLATVSADYFRPIGGARHDDDRIRLTGTRGMIEVIDGIAYIENDAPRRELVLPPPKDAFGEFLRSIEDGSSASFAQSALYSTRVALLAREAADAHKIIRL